MLKIINYKKKSGKKVFALADVKYFGLKKDVLFTAPTKEVVERYIEVNKIKM